MSNIASTPAATITRITRTVTPIVASKSEETRAMRIEALGLKMRQSATPRGILADHYGERAAALRAEADRLDGLVVA